MPNAVLRMYTNAPGLVDAILAHESEVRALLTGVSGFRSWGMVRTEAGAYSITVCEDKAGCDETVRIAADWVKANVPGDIAPPIITEGEAVLRFVAEGIPA